VAARSTGRFSTTVQAPAVDGFFQSVILADQPVPAVEAAIEDSVPGDPAEATAQAGEIILETMTHEYVDQIEAARDAV